MTTGTSTPSDPAVAEFKARLDDATNVLVASFGDEIVQLRGTIAEREIEVDDLKKRLAHYELPSVMPFRARDIRRGVGVCSHPTFRTTVYKYRDEWFKMLSDMKVGYFRGDYTGDADALVVANLCRKYKIKWLMLLVPENMTMTEKTLRAKIAHIAANASDVCIGIEGVNEPNSNRNGTPVDADWPTKTTFYQKIIFETVRSYRSLDSAVVVGASLNDSACAKSYLAHAKTAPGGIKHYHQLATVGFFAFIDQMGVHKYSGGDIELIDLETRLAWINDAAKREVPTWVTETGYTNATGSPKAGHHPTDQRSSGVYAGRTIFEAALRGVNVAWYELLDDPDPGFKNVESNFGLYAVNTIADPQFRVKPAAQEISEVNMWLSEDTDNDAQLAAIHFKVDGPEDLRVVPVQFGDGSSYVVIWRILRVWDQVAQKPINVPAAECQLTDMNGTRKVMATEYPIWYAVAN